MISLAAIFQLKLSSTHQPGDSLSRLFAEDDGNLRTLGLLFFRPLIDSEVSNEKFSGFPRKNDDGFFII